MLFKKTFILIILLSSLFLSSQTYTFTPAGAIGRYGPTQTQVNTSYSNTSLSGVVTVSNGIQSWTVPTNGIYRIIASGAEAGLSYYGTGYGARVQGDFTLTAGQVLKICVGQPGAYGDSGGGGGGSFVASTTNTPYIIAGGGGSNAHGSYASLTETATLGSSGTSGMPGSSGVTSLTAGTGGTLGTGGGVSSTYTTGQGSGGGGLTGNGVDGNPSTGGLAFVNGAIGGAGVSSTVGIGGDGGFGGGGGADWTINTGSGGGGGYSGGGGGTDLGYGGGGGSYNAGSNQTNSTGVNPGNGSVIIMPLFGINIVQTASVICHGQLNAALTASAFGGTPPYSYSWSPMAITSSVVSGLGAGTYTCYTTDANSLIYTRTFIITEPDTLIAITSHSNVTCNGANNGIASLQVSGGVAPYAYTWTPFVNSSNNGIVGQVAPGSYTCLASDAMNCTVSGTFLITQPPALSVTAVASSSLICMGQTLSITGYGAQTYTLSTSLNNGAVFTPTTTDTYYILGKDAAGCTAYGIITVTVYTSPTVSIAGSNTLCVGNSANLFASGAQNYYWSTAVFGSSISVSPTLTSVYSVTGTAANGCQNIAVKTLSILNISIITANASNSIVCAGNTLTLFGNGAATYTWTNGILNNSPFIPSSTASYTVTGVGACNSVTAAITVTVNTLPSVMANASSTLICSGSTVSLSGSGAVSYTWTNGVTNNVAFPLLSSTNFSVTGTDANGCKNTASISVTTNSLPLVTASVSSSTVCLGNSLIFNGGGANSYTWTSSVTNNSAYVPTSNSSYTVTGTDLNGCKNTASISVVVVPVPTVIAHSSNPAVCAGNSLTLYGSGASSYTWSGTVVDNSSFVPSATNSYTVLGSNACFTSSSVITVTVNSLPNIIANASNTVVCQGSTVTLLGSGAQTYTWSGTITNGVAFIPASSGIYTLTGTDANGCQNVATQTINVNALPTVTLSASNLIICAGNTITLNASGADTYTLNSGTLSSPILLNTNASYSLSGTNTLTGCSSTNVAVQTITVNSLPSLTITTSSSTICNGQPVSLTASGANIYNWSNAVINGIPFFPSSSTTYSVIGTNTLTGCTNSGSQTINVNALPVVSLSASTLSICAGSTVVLNAQGANTYTINGGVITGVPFAPVSTTSYSVSGTNTLTGCSSTNTAVQTITVNSLPILTIATSQATTCSGETFTLTANGANTYTWNTNQISSSIFDQQSGVTIYTVQGTDVNGCMASNSFTQDVVDCTGISEQNKNSAFTIFPNPNNGEFYISGDVQINLFVFNELGEIVKSVFLNETTKTVFITELTNGIYFIVGQKNNQMIRQKIIVSR